MIRETGSAEETFALGKTIGEAAKPGDILLLRGDLGVGKTVLAQGIAAGLGVQGPVNSPTFTILQEYRDGRLPLYHFDVYRIEEPEEMEEVGFEEYLFGDGVALIEWPERIAELLPEDAVEINIKKELNKGFDYRIIEIDEKN